MGESKVVLGLSRNRKHTSQYLSAPSSGTDTYLADKRVISNDADRCKSFLHFITCIEHTSSWAQELRLFWSLCSSGFTLSCSALAFINLVLPTSHLFDH